MNVHSVVIVPPLSSQKDLVIYGFLLFSLFTIATIDLGISLNTAPAWPSWPSAIAGDAIKGWTPRRANSFEKPDKEPASVAFSALNMAMHFHGWLSFFILLHYSLLGTPTKEDWPDVTTRLKVWGKNIPYGNVRTPSNANT
ncbi:hypothetical protein L1987_45467 [Smallanthus sonchifolius]|uniref:Uncharacterized protein n=1 Tax=Smallanthus sonchifolius TaxID=185202 RepID=A0ACB9FX33_9ASTR|nr:hypothetical protein L1987_45467 [Smallanthus sonchifolius]